MNTFVHYMLLDLIYDHINTFVILVSALEPVVLRRKEMLTNGTAVEQSFKFS